MVTGVIPSVYVNVKGAAPVKLNETSGNVPPLHIVPPPVTLETVGSGFTITFTDAPRLVATQPLASLNAVTEYVPAGALLIEKVGFG